MEATSRVIAAFTVIGIIIGFLTKPGDMFVDLALGIIAGLLIAALVALRWL